MEKKTVYVLRVAEKIKGLKPRKYYVARVCRDGLFVSDCACQAMKFKWAWGANLVRWLLGLIADMPKTVVVSTEVKRCK